MAHYEQRPRAPHSASFEILVRVKYEELSGVGDVDERFNYHVEVTYRLS